MGNVLQKFRLDGRVAIITGGAGLLGVQHAKAIAEAGGTPVLWDIDGDTAQREAVNIQSSKNTNSIGMEVDITDLASIQSGLNQTLSLLKRVDILINNAANNPKVDNGNATNWSRFGNFGLEAWNQDMAVGLTGAFLCSQVIGAHLAKQNRGIILNVASDLSVISPDQRLYREEGIPEDKQPVKPVTYSVIKHGLVGLTKYLATYWAANNIRVNAISPGGVYAGQPDHFVNKLINLIPVGRMASIDEYKAAILFLCSDASSYMTGQNIIIDGGRTVL
jgi:NAD(P)-dependent dehydrogenase (short-subunit alcohol dehydrogenase family)